VKDGTMNDSHELLHRRRFLGRTSLGLGALAATELFAGRASRAEGRSSQANLGPHFRPRARRVIYLHLSGGPSQLDTFDPKPGLRKHHGKPLPESIRGEQRLTTMTRQQKRIDVLASGQKFARYGESGLEMNRLFEKTAGHADKLCLIRSVYTEPINHDPAVTFLQTGSPLSGRPAMGSWMSYGLGTENADLPAFVVLLSGGGQPTPSRYWQNGFLPSRHQGVQLRSGSEPVLFLSNPAGISKTTRGKIVNRISELNALRHEKVRDPKIEARIDAFQLAYRMQTSVPALMSLDGESKGVLEDYGAQPGKSSFANNCLLARRLAEAGVRFIQLYDRGWDHHGNVESGIQSKIRQVDRPIAALISDLDRRGLLDETLIVCGGEFGRTTYGQGGKGKHFGRDHHPRCFTTWFAGGGIRGGMTVGRTDDYSYNIVEDPVHVHDLQATILHCLGIDHERLLFRFKGRDFRLTDIAGAVRHDFLG